MKRRLKTRGALALLLAAALLQTNAATAFSSGATVCEVNALPFAPMATLLRNPAPGGWSLRADAGRWYSGVVRELRIVNADPTRRARGVLIWVKGSFGGSPVGLGRFVDASVSSLYQYAQATPPTDCAEWALTHTSAQPKSQSELVFYWQAPDAGWGNLVARAFVIEDCASTQGTCRDAQALTEFLLLREALFVDGFE